MSTISLADRVRASNRSRSPVQDTVGELFDDITAARAEGMSFRALHRQLTKEGRNVGRGHTSLFTAYKIVKDRRDRSSSSRQSGGSERTCVPKSPATESKPTALLREVADPARMPLAVIDTRRKTTEW